MKSLTHLNDDPTYLARYVAIRDKKQNPIRAALVGAHALIESRYEAYTDAVDQGALAGVQIHAQVLALSASLRACYNGPTRPLKDLKQAIRDAQPKRLLKYCPMCGTTLPGTFDHYMPAVRFPEFAVHPLNLVPCCAKCNSIKDDDWLSAAGARQFLHAYTDQVPELELVHVTLCTHPAFDGVGANFSLQRPAQIADELWNLIDSHFRRLKLIERYDDRGNDEIGEILADCGAHLSAGGADVRNFLRGRAADRRAVYGTNHWIAVLMQAMSEHPNLDAWVDLATL